MKATVRGLVLAAAFGGVVTGCDSDRAVGVRPSVRRPTLASSVEESTAPLILHIVAPKATDPAIDVALDNHYVWLDSTAKGNNKLFLFMHGSGQRAALFQLVQQEAARLGYHVIGLTYPSGPFGFAMRCPSDANPSACFESARLEILTGADLNPIFQVSVANSIDNRVTKLLQYLVAQYPEEGWERYLQHGAPKWSQIAVGGHSQGGNEAAMIAKIRMVPRVVMFSSVTDNAVDGAPSWEATHLTPAERYWGIAHDRDPAYPFIRSGWDSLGLAAFGQIVAPESSVPPYSFTHMLVTDLTPVGGFVGTNAHGSPSQDLTTPRRTDGTPVLLDAWRYLLTAHLADDDAMQADDRKSEAVPRR